MSLSTLTIAESLQQLRSKKVSSVELTKSCLARIKKTDSTIKAFLTVDESSSLSQAEKADKHYVGEDKRPLLGVPISIKDNFCTKGLRTTAASKVLDNFIPPYDATVVHRLKDAGAVIIGKTNMDAWAHGSSTETSDYGPTRNPWDTNRLPGGSSGGSAASIAADQVIASIGSETAGSIRGPASWCGVVGLKPTYGRVSRYGVIAMGSSFDSPGPITKTVQDAAIILEVIAGKDRYDATTSTQKTERYTSSLKNGLQGITIGVPEEYLAVSETSVVRKVEEALKVFQKLGAKLKRINLMHPKYAIAVYTILQRSEVSSNLARFDGVRYGNTRKHFGDEAKRRIMFGTYTLSHGYYDAYYKKAQKVRTVIINDFKQVFNKIDLIAGPTMPMTALKVGETKKHAMFGEAADVLTEASSIAGLSGISINCGFLNNLPVGLQIFGPQFSESRVLQAAYSYEQVTDWHKQKPKL